MPSADLPMRLILPKLVRIPLIILRCQKMHQLGPDNSLHVSRAHLCLQLLHGPPEIQPVVGPVQVTGRDLHLLAETYFPTGVANVFTAAVTSTHDRTAKSLPT